MGKDLGKYTTAIKRKVWDKAMPIQGHPADIWRRDKDGNVIHWQEYGNTDAKYGWKIINTQPHSDEPADIEYLHAVHIEISNV